MNTEAQAFFEQWPARMTEIKNEAPEMARAFAALFQAVMKPGALTAKEKELIALGIALSVRCVPCINTHVQKALAAGATRAQVMEAAGVAVMMQGGPSYTTLPRVIEALEALESQTAAVSS